MVDSTVTIAFLCGTRTFVGLLLAGGGGKDRGFFDGEKPVFGWRISCHGPPKISGRVGQMWGWVENNFGFWIGKRWNRPSSEGSQPFGWARVRRGRCGRFLRWTVEGERRMRWRRGAPKGAAHCRRWGRGRRGSLAIPESLRETRGGTP